MPLKCALKYFNSKQLIDRQMHLESYSLSLGQNWMQINLSEQAICFQFMNQTLKQKYSNSYDFQGLPLEFKIVFESLNELFKFISNTDESAINVKEGILCLTIAILGKHKQFKLPLQRVELTNEERLKQKIEQLQNLLKTKNNLFTDLTETIKIKDQVIEEKQTDFINFTSSLKEKQTERLKLLQKIKSLQNQIFEIHSQNNQKQFESESKGQSKEQIQEYRPIKKNITIKQKRSRQIQYYGKKITLKVDENAKFVDKFKINGNEVYKLQGATYQLHHREALPKEGKFYFDIKLVQIKNSNIVVGVITDRLIEEQSSFKKIDCVCYNGHDGSICEQEKQKFVGIRPKDGNKIRTVIDVTQTIIEWHLIGNDAKCLIGKAVLPETMSKQLLYPFFELYWEGSKLKMNL